MYRPWAVGCDCCGSLEEAPPPNGPRWWWRRSRRYCSASAPGGPRPDPSSFPTATGSRWMTWWCSWWAWATGASHWWRTVGSWRGGAGLVGAAPWGRHQWERIAEGELFDGMESWLPWLSDGDELITDLLGDDAVVGMVEPRRVRDRAGELLDEESALADALASTWGLRADGADGGDADGEAPHDAATATPRLHVPYDRLLASTSAAVISLVPSAEGPDVPFVESRGWEPILGDGAKLAAQVSTLAEAGYAVVLCSTTEGGAQRLSGILAEEGVTVPVAADATDLPAPGAHIVVATVDRGFVLPGC